MIVWGGGPGNGGIYDPEEDSWVPVATEGAPRGRYQHVAVWTGTEMIVWGGGEHQEIFGDGGRFTP